MKADTGCLLKDLKKATFTGAVVRVRQMRKMFLRCYGKTMEDEGRIYNLAPTPSNLHRLMKSAGLSFPLT